MIFKSQHDIDLLATESLVHRSQLRPRERNETQASSCIAVALSSQEAEAGATTSRSRYQASLARRDTDRNAKSWLEMAVDC